MRRILLLPLLLLWLPACNESAPPVSYDGQEVLADAHFFPMLPGSTWEYRVDTTGASGTVRGAGLVRARVVGSYDNDSLSYAVQVNEITLGGTTESDSLYVRHAPDGVRISSPGLQTLSGLPPIPNFPIGEIPSEFLAVPAAGTFISTWELINIEINTIPLFPIYYRVKGSYLGLENVTTENGVFRDCAHVVLTLEARLPDLQDLTNPILLNESADFWFSRPQGLVVADGSNAIFTLLRGSVPLERTYGRMREEITSMNITQPDPFCIQ